MHRLHEIMVGMMVGAHKSDVNILMTRYKY